MVLIGAQLRRLRKERGMSQRDLGQKTGLQCGYISRVENGHIVPSLESLERLANGLGIQLWELFYTGKHWHSSHYLIDSHGHVQERGKAGREARFLLKLRPFLGRIPEKDRAVLLSFAKRLAAHSRNRPAF